MTPQRVPPIRLVCVAIIAIVLAVAAEACGPSLVFRAYLGPTLWQPLLKYVGELKKTLPPEKTAYVPYAGMWPSGGTDSLQRLRDAYRELFPDNPPLTLMGVLNWPDETLQNLRDLARNTTASPEETDELELLRCKIELRAAKLDDQTALSQVEICFDNYLARPREVALSSEARGWKARTQFLLGKYASAAKFYLDELNRETSNIKRERLLDSLRLIDPKQEELEEYLDTPSHALYAANRITNSPNNSIQSVLIQVLESHSELFRQGADSNALAIALMRAATRMGAPDATLRYAERVPSSSDLRKTGEYNWLVAVARFQQKDYAAAESALKKVFDAAGADPRQKAYAAYALIGVYAKTNHTLEQLWAAFQAESWSQDRNMDSDAPAPGLYSTELWDDGLRGLPFDSAYLLDVQMTDSELRDYIQRFGNAPNSGVEKVRYAFAVRLTRHEDYLAAARIFDQLNSPRADLTMRAAKLLADTKAPGLSATQRLEALYEYAFFISANEDNLFFNDKLWSGSQTAAFMRRNTDLPIDRTYGQGRFFTSDEAERFDQIERRLRDDQEEYWRAFQILNDIVEKAGPTPLGRKAATRALFCLRRISTDRFGRSAEIRAADFRLSKFLANK